MSIHITDEMAAEAKREYFRQWRKKNKDKIKKYNQSYWRKYAERKAVEVEIAAENKKDAAC